MPDEIIARSDSARNFSPAAPRSLTMQPVVIRSSRIKLSLGLCAIAGLFAAAGLVPGLPVPVVLTALVPAAVLGLTTVREILDRRPRITIDDKGICDRGNTFGLVEWDDISRAYRGRWLSSSIVLLQVRNPTKYNDRVSPLRRLLRQTVTSTVPVSISGTQGNAKQLAELIEAEVRRRWIARATEII